MSQSSINISQTANIFAIGYENGFAVYNLSPVVEIKNVDIGSIKHVAIYNRSNIIALVGDTNFTRTTFDSGNIVHIWDDKLSVLDKTIMKIEYKLPIMHIEFCGNYFIVVLKSELYIYEIQTNDLNQFVNLEYQKNIITYDNPYGLFLAIMNNTMNNSMNNPTNCSLNNYNTLSTIKSFSTMTFITLGTQIGQVYINTFITEKQIEKQKQIINKKIIKHDKMIQCHKNAIVSLALNNQSTIFATVSSNGTNIHVYNSNTGRLVYKLHRGYTYANITSIAFSNNNEYISCTSNFSLHIFKLDSTKEHITYTFEKSLTMKTLWITSDEILNICSIGSDKYIEYLWIKMKLQENNQTQKKEIIRDGYGKLVKPDINDLFRIT